MAPIQDTPNSPVGEDDSIRADFNTLASSAENYAIVAADLKRDLDDLETKLKTLLAGWLSDPSAEGQAASARDAYDQYEREWSQAAAHMQHVVHQLGLSIGTARENYVTAEKHGHAIFTPGSA